MNQGAKRSNKLGLTTSESVVLCVAFAQVRVGDVHEGVALSALREVGLLKELSHPHIVTLLDVFPHKANIKLVSIDALRALSAQPLRTEI